MKKAFLTALLMLVLIVAEGQAKWEIGISGSGWMYMGDLAPERLPVLGDLQAGGGMLVRRRLSGTLALRGNFSYGRLSGSDSNIQDEEIRSLRHIAFRSSITEGALLLEWEPFAAKRHPGAFQFRKIISPYIFAGGAWFMNHKATDYSAMPAEGLWEKVRMDQNAERNNRGFTIPFGGGIHFDLGKGSAVGIEMAARPALRDDLDGVRFAGNPHKNDWYATAGMNYNYRFTPKDRDGDQIPDKFDICPTLPGVLSARGCPDADGDGLEDLEDMCPHVFGPRAANGCPDADGDNLPDHQDDCPLEAGPEALKGCPDADEDGIADKDDRCPQAAGPVQYEGCPDTDDDCIPDPDDACPDEAGAPEKQGCPYRDRDDDCVFDDFDECPDEPGMEAFNGCPDSDADNIPDKADRCPYLAGAPELRGCPLMPEEKKKVLLTARWGVEFETGSATLKPRSSEVLGQIASLMEAYPGYHLQISGHTDSRGDAAKNLELSKRRAKSCVDYLVSKGIAPQRLSAQGFGKTKPIASNKTATGRSKNRRVEFELTVPQE